MHLKYIIIGALFGSLVYTISVVTTSFVFTRSVRLSSVVPRDGGRCSTRFIDLTTYASETDIASAHSGRTLTVTEIVVQIK